MRNAVLAMLGILLMTSLVFAASTRIEGDNLNALKERTDEIAELRQALNKNLTNPNISNEDKMEIRAQLRMLSNDSVNVRDIVRKAVRNNLRERLGEGEEGELLRGMLMVRRVQGELMELRENNGSMAIRTRLNLSENATSEELRAQLSNGKNALIKVMPDAASEQALERLRLKNCNGNCSIELKEVGNKAVYEARARKTYKVLGIFKNREEVETQIDAESGEEIMTTKRPWWAWMASESEEADELEE